MFLDKSILIFFSQLHDVTHVQFIECCQHGVCVLSLLQTTGNLHPHPVHLDPVFRSCSSHAGGRVSWGHLHHWSCSSCWTWRHGSRRWGWWRRCSCCRSFSRSRSSSCPSSTT